MALILNARMLLRATAMRGQGTGILLQNPGRCTCAQRYPAYAELLALRTNPVGKELLVARFRIGRN